MKHEFVFMLSYAWPGYSCMNIYGGNQQCSKVAQPGWVRRMRLLRSGGCLWRKCKQFRILFTFIPQHSSHFHAGHPETEWAWSQGATSRDRIISIVLVYVCPPKFISFNCCSSEVCFVVKDICSRRQNNSGTRESNCKSMSAKHGTFLLSYIALACHQQLLL